MERQLRGKPVGIRTSVLLCWVLICFYQQRARGSMEKILIIHVVGQIITGIGFLGAGVMLAKDGAVVMQHLLQRYGIASIGVVIATDNLLAAIKLSVLVVGILYGVDVLEAKFKSLGRGVHARVKRYSKLYYRKEKWLDIRLEDLWAFYTIKPASLDDLLLVDSQIPEFDGRNTLSKLQTKCADVEHLALVAYIDNEPAPINWVMR